jgi:hypothetical protein
MLTYIARRENEKNADILKLDPLDLMINQCRLKLLEKYIMFGADAAHQIVFRCLENIYIYT